MNYQKDYPDSPVIEQMSAADLEAVAAIEKDSFTDPWPLESFRTELNTNNLAYYLVARLDGEVVGYIGAWLILEEVHITTLAVAEPYRRRGIASRLVETLIEETRPKGARFLTLEVRPSNRAALKFYEKFGFTALGRRKRYYIDEDAIIMTREDLETYEK